MVIFVVFQGGLIHAGSAWNGSARYRLHCYFHQPNVSFPDTSTKRALANTSASFIHVPEIIDEEFYPEMEQT